MAKAMNLEVVEMPVNEFECLDCEETFTAKEYLQMHQNQVCQKYQCESAFPIFENMLWSIVRILQPLVP